MLKRFYGKFRILLFAVALGLASVPFIKILHEQWVEVEVELPQVESENTFFVVPYSFSENALVKEDRDLSLYALGGNHSYCSKISGNDLEKCEFDKNEARDFIWKHWKDNQRAYIVLESKDNESFSRDHIFIEPDENGEWILVVKNVSTERKYAWGLWIREGEYRSVEFFTDAETGNRRLRLFTKERHTDFRV